MYVKCTYIHTYTMYVCVQYLDMYVLVCDVDFCSRPMCCVYAPGRLNYLALCPTQDGMMCSVFLLNSGLFYLCVCVCVRQVPGLPRAPLEFGALRVHAPVLARPGRTPGLHHRLRGRSHILLILFGPKRQASKYFGRLY